MKNWLKTISYVDICLVVTNTIVLFFAVNLIVSIFFLAKDKISASSNQGTTRNAVISQGGLFDDAGAPVDNGRRTSYQTAWFDYTAYEGIVDETYAGTVLDDFTNLSARGFAYEPWVQFSEPLYQGKLVHVDVDAQGLPKRRTVNVGPSAKSSVIRIFTFGGSTTFGYNVSDEHTWSSYLSSLLNQRAEMLGQDVRVEVTNYGRGYYYTTQEVLLLMSLLRRGQRPHLVIFLDGVNEDQSCRDAPYFTERLQEAMDNLQAEHQQSLIQKIDWLPIVRLIEGIRFNTITEHDKPDVKTNDCYTNLAKTPELGSESAAQYEQNVRIARIVSSLYAVKTLFFLQPDATYNYPIELYRNVEAKTVILQNRKYAEEFYDKAKSTEGVIDLTSLFKEWGHGRKAIVDDVHYSPRFNEFLAQHVVDQIDLASVKQGAPGLPDMQSK